MASLTTEITEHTEDGGDLGNGGRHGNIFHRGGRRGRRERQPPGERPGDGRFHHGDLESTEDGRKPANGTATAPVAPFT